MKHLPYTPDDKAFMVANYLTMKRSEIAKHLCRTTASVRVWLKKHRYIMDSESIKKLDIRRTNTFKKGHIPQNTKKDMDVVIRHSKKMGDCKFIRISKNNWYPYQIYVWEGKNGPVLKGYIIRFKDGNRMNCNIENLEMISKTDHLKRNNSKFFAGKTALKLEKQIMKEFITRIGSTPVEKEIIRNHNVERFIRVKPDYFTQDKDMLIPSSNDNGKIPIRVDSKTIVYVHPGKYENIEIIRDRFATKALL